MFRLRLVIPAAAAAVLALAAYGTHRWAGGPGRALPRHGGAYPSEQRDAAATRAAALEARLEQEATERARLERRVAHLDERVSELARRLAGRSAAGPARPEAHEEDLAEAEPTSRRGFDETALLDAGFSASEAAELRARVDGISMRSLELWDRASREGWVGTSRFQEEATAVSRPAQLEALRRDVGDDAFDWAIFAAGYDNRARVDAVLANSAAAAAGIRPGDLVIAYANERVFDGGQLIRASTRGRAGELVAVDLQRGGTRLAVYVPRGPLGLHLDGTRKRPDPVR